MTTHADHQKALAIKAGQDHRFLLDVQEDDGSDADFTGATALTDAVKIVPKTGSSFTVDLVLDGTPNAAPQAYFDVVPADTLSLVPQRISVYITVTKADGKIDKPSFEFELLRGS